MSTPPDIEVRCTYGDWVHLGSLEEVQRVESFLGQPLRVLAGKLPWSEIDRPRTGPFVAVEVDKTGFRVRLESPGAARQVMPGDWIRLEDPDAAADTNRKE